MNVPSVYGPVGSEFNMQQKVKELEANSKGKNVDFLKKNL
jgi:hypothetical protein